MWGGGQGVKGVSLQGPKGVGEQSGSVELRAIWEGGFLSQPPWTRECDPYQRPSTK